jgi:uncharacterized membrane protein YqjE
MHDASPGLMESVRQLLSTLISILSTRLELLGNELQEERLRITQMLLFTLCALFCFGMGLLLLTVFFVVLFWDYHRLLVLGGMSVVFFVSGGILIQFLRSKAMSKSSLFADSLAELSRDRDQLES